MEVCGPRLMAASGAKSESMLPAAVPVIQPSPTSTETRYSSASHRTKSVVGQVRPTSVENWSKLAGHAAELVQRQPISAFILIALRAAPVAGRSEVQPPTRIAGAGRTVEPDSVRWLQCSPACGSRKTLREPRSGC
jgi:hypothetical protein